MRCGEVEGKARYLECLVGTGGELHPPSARTTDSLLGLARPERPLNNHKSRSLFEPSRPVEAPNGTSHSSPPTAASAVQGFLVQEVETVLSASAAHRTVLTYGQMGCKAPWTPSW